MIIEELNNQIKSCISNNSPFAIGKIGSERLSALNSYISTRNTTITELLYKNSGVFPQTTEAGKDFFVEFFAAIENLDYVLTSFGVLNSTAKVKRIGSSLNTIFVPYLLKDPWTSQLINKTVLVISPFSESIKSQFSKRKDVWKNNWSELLPFKLDTITAPFSYAICSEDERLRFFGGQKTWKEAYDNILTQINTKEFDLIMVGAGSYSIPICSYAKSIGKIGIDMGGGLQTLFGIRGNRWDKMPLINQYYNQYWVYPMPNEIPKFAKYIEGACYWK